LAYVHHVHDVNIVKHSIVQNLGELGKSDRKHYRYTKKEKETFISMWNSEVYYNSRLM